MSDDEDRFQPDAEGNIAGQEVERDETFKQVNWADIDQETDTRTKIDYLWMAVFAAWAVGFALDLISRYILDSQLSLGPGEIGFQVVETLYLGFELGGGPIAYPLIGTTTLVDWLWVITLLLLLNYGARPLYENPRMTKQYWKEFRKNKAAVISSIYLTVIFLVGLVGSRFIEAPRHNPGLENQPPIGLDIPSFATGVECPGGRTDTPDGQLCQGSWEHPLGTTPFGEDILAGIIHGMEVSMQVGLIATMISITVSATVALTAAYYGGIVDEILMRYVDIQLTFPTFFLFLLLAYTIGGSLFILIMIFGFFGWGGYARIMRAEALQRREETYMTAAKSAGASTLWSIRRHLLPNISNSIITAASLAIPALILAEAAIAFLGLGDPTTPSWGRIIAEGRDELGRAWWTSTLPGIFLFFTVLAFNFLGDALRDALDPRHGGAE